MCSLDRPGLTGAGHTGGVLSARNPEFTPTVPAFLEGYSVAPACRSPWDQPESWAHPPPPGIQAPVGWLKPSTCSQLRSGTCPAPRDQTLQGCLFGGFQCVPRLRQGSWLGGIWQAVPSTAEMSGMCPDPKLKLTHCPPLCPQRGNQQAALTPLQEVDHVLVLG